MCRLSCLLNTFSCDIGQKSPAIGRSIRVQPDNLDTLSQIECSERKPHRPRGEPLEDWGLFSLIGHSILLDAATAQIHFSSNRYIQRKRAQGEKAGFMELVRRLFTAHGEICFVSGPQGTGRSTGPRQNYPDAVDRRLFALYRKGGAESTNPQGGYGSLFGRKRQSGNDRQAIARESPGNHLKSLGLAVPLWASMDSFGRSCKISRHRRLFSCFVFSFLNLSYIIYIPLGGALLHQPGIVVFPVIRVLLTKEFCHEKRGCPRHR